MIKRPEIILSVIAVLIVLIGNVYPVIFNKDGHYQVWPQYVSLAGLLMAFAVLTFAMASSKSAFISKVTNNILIGIVVLFPIVFGGGSLLKYKQKIEFSEEMTEKYETAKKISSFDNSPCESHYMVAKLRYYVSGEEVKYKNCDNSDVVFFPDKTDIETRKKYVTVTSSLLVNKNSSILWLLSFILALVFLLHGKKKEAK